MSIPIWLNNPWVIGIGGGIISGLIVALIFRGLFSRRDRKEYLQKLVTANQEVLYALRPGVADGVMPSAEVIDSLKGATARKYDIDPNDVYDLNDIANALIKEIMDSSFLPASGKNDYCDKLSKLKEPPEHQAEQSVTVRHTAIERGKERMIMTMSLTFGIMTALMAFFLVFYKERGALLLESSSSIIPIISVLVAAIAALLLSFLLMAFRSQLKEKLEEKKEKITSSSSSSSSLSSSSLSS